ncbi:hypothetical protein [Coxiella burnetii]|uniref:hypothetical protein n=2 Tax=Coxiella burnetii TaxID=777 RepID=UPI0022317574|nr:hypothetical protein [Coxiella burnetii]
MHLTQLFTLHKKPEALQKVLEEKLQSPNPKDKVFAWMWFVSAKENCPLNYFLRSINKDPFDLAEKKVKIRSLLAESFLDLALTPEGRKLMIACDDSKDRGILPVLDDFPSLQTQINEFLAQKIEFCDASGASFSMPKWLSTLGSKDDFDFFAYLLRKEDSIIATDEEAIATLKEEIKTTLFSESWDERSLFCKLCENIEGKNILFDPERDLLNCLLENNVVSQNTIIKQLQTFFTLTIDAHIYFKRTFEFLAGKHFRWFLSKRGYSIFNFLLNLSGVRNEIFNFSNNGVIAKSWEFLSAAEKNDFFSFLLESKDPNTTNLHDRIFNHIHITTRINEINARKKLFGPEDLKCPLLSEFYQHLQTTLISPDGEINLNKVAKLFNNCYDYNPETISTIRLLCLFESQRNILFAPKGLLISLLKALSQEIERTNPLIITEDDKLFTPTKLIILRGFFDENIPPINKNTLIQPHSLTHYLCDQEPSEAVETGVTVLLDYFKLIRGKPYQYENRRCFLSPGIGGHSALFFLVRNSNLRAKLLWPYRDLLINLLKSEPHDFFGLSPNFSVLKNEIFSTSIFYYFLKDDAGINFLFNESLVHCLINKLENIFLFLLENTQNLPPSLFEKLLSLPSHSFFKEFFMTISNNPKFCFSHLLTNFFGRALLSKYAILYWSQSTFILNDLYKSISQFYSTLLQEDFLFLFGEQGIIRNLFNLDLTEPSLRAAKELLVKIIKELKQSGSLLLIKLPEFNITWLWPTVNDYVEKSSDQDLKKAFCEIKPEQSDSDCSFSTNMPLSFFNQPIITNVFDDEEKEFNASKRLKMLPE